ncbi:hypothetical protein [Clostridium beijerinckii]
MGKLLSVISAATILFISTSVNSSSPSLTVPENATKAFML